MPFFPDVNAGDPFVPNARLSNEVRHIVNRMNGFLSGTITAGKTTGSLCIKGYNPTSDETIAAGNVVIIPEGPIVEDAFPVATMIDGEYHMLVDSWGIAQEEIGPKKVGSVLVMGAAIVPIISETGTDTFEYVKPVAGGGSFKKAKRGIAKYIRPIGTTHALIFVGISSGMVYEQGKGVKITGGTYGISPVISSEITGGTDITVSGGTDGQPYVISYTGSGGGGGGGIGFPDYLALNKLPSGLPAPSREGIGSTYLLPVKAGVSIKYFSPIQYCVALFAVADGWDGTPYVLTNDTAYTTPAAGWVRISILDDGDHQNGCLRFYVGTSDWTKALPLYRCGTFRAGATGISSKVSGGTATISLTGGTGSVKIKPGNNVSISGQTNGVIEISATGGGGGGGYIPRWGTHFHYSPQVAADKNWMYYDETHDQTIVELYTLNPRHMTAGARGYLKGSSLSPDNSFTTAAEGYLFCFAEIACDGNATASNPGSVHAVIGYGQFKVCSVYGSSISVGGSVVIPIRANQTIELNMSNIDTSSSIIGMIFYENGKDYRYPDESE